MTLQDIFFNIDFWRNVYLVSKWLFIALSLVLITGIIWLLYRISSFRQKLNVGAGYKEYAKKPTSPEALPREEKEEKQSYTIKVEAKDANELARLQIKKIVNSKWQEIVAKAESESEKEWKLAIIEADALVDLVLKRSGYRGETMLERLKAVLPENLSSLTQLWEAHKIRNQIAHNPEFILPQKEMIKILKIYKLVLKELKTLI